MSNLNDENRKRVDAIRNSISRWVKILGSDRFRRKRSYDRISYR